MGEIAEFDTKRRRRTKKKTDNIAELKNSIKTFNDNRDLTQF